MTAYLSFEWLKFSKRWMPRVILGLMAGLLVLAFWGFSRGQDQPNLFLPRGWLTALILFAGFAPFFWPVLGGSWAGNEYGWGTIRSVLTRRPQRVEHIMAAVAVLLAGVGLALLVVLVVASGAGAVVAVLTHHGAVTSGIFTGSFVGTLLKGFVTAWYVSAFYLVLAYVAATLFRSAAVGIGFGIGSTLAEFILRGIFFGLGGFWKVIAQHFPAVYTNDLVTQVVGPQLVPGSNLASVGSNAPGIAEAIVWLAVYLAIMLVAVAVTVRQRDVTA